MYLLPRNQTPMEAMVDNLQQQKLAKQAAWERIQSQKSPEPRVPTKTSYLGGGRPQPAQSIPQPQPMPNEIQAQTGFIPQPMSDITPQPPRLSRYLGTRPQPASLPNVASLTVDVMPNQAASVPLPNPNMDVEPTAPLGLTDRRNASGITPPAPVPKQSNNIDELSNIPKVVRGSEPQDGYLGTRPTLDPMSQARNEVGDLKKLGFWGRLGQIGKGALLGLANSGGGDLGQVLGSALGGAIGGGTDMLRRAQRQQQINQRANELTQQRAYERQLQQDELARRVTESNLENVRIDNDRQLQDLAERKRRNRVNEDQGQQKIDNAKTLNTGKFNLGQLRVANDIAKNFKNTGKPIPDAAADLLGLEPGTVIEDDPKEPNKFSILKLRNGEIYRFDKSSGQITIADIQDTPLPNPAQDDARAKAAALAGIQQDPNAPAGYTLTPEARQFMEKNGYKPDDPNLQYYFQAAGINSPYIDITKTPQFNQGLINEKAKGSTYLGGGRPNTQPTTTQTNSQNQIPKRTYKPTDIEQYKRLKNHPQARQAFMSTFGVDPDTLISK